MLPPPPPPAARDSCRMASLPTALYYSCAPPDSCLEHPADGKELTWAPSHAHPPLLIRAQLLSVLSLIGEVLPRRLEWGSGLIAELQHSGSAQPRDSCLAFLIYRKG